MKIIQVNPGHNKPLHPTALRVTAFASFSVAAANAAPLRAAGERRRYLDIVSGLLMTAKTLRFIPIAFLIAISMLSTSCANSPSPEMRKQADDWSIQSITMAGQGNSALLAEALSLSNKALEVDPNCSRYLKARALVKKQMKDYKGAVDDYSSVIIIDPNDPASWNNRALAKAALNDFKGAIYDANMTITLQPNELAPLKTRASIKVRANDYHGALEDYDHCLRLNISAEQRSKVYFLRADVLQEMGNEMGYYNSLIKAYELLPNNNKNAHD